MNNILKANELLFPLEQLPNQFCKYFMSKSTCSSYQANVLVQTLNYNVTIIFSGISYKYIGFIINLHFLASLD